MCQSNCYFSTQHYLQRLTIGLKHPCAIQWNRAVLQGYWKLDVAVHDFLFHREPLFPFASNYPTHMKALHHGQQWVWFQILCLRSSLASLQSSLPILLYRCRAVSSSEHYAYRHPLSWWRKPSVLLPVKYPLTFHKSTLHENPHSSWSTNNHAIVFPRF